MAAVTFHRLSSTYELRQVEGTPLPHVSIENKSLLSTSFVQLLAKSTPFHVNLVKCHNVSTNAICELVRTCLNVTTLELPKKLKTADNVNDVFYKIFQSNPQLKSLIQDGNVIERDSFLSAYVIPQQNVVENEKKEPSEDHQELLESNPKGNSSEEDDASQSCFSRNFSTEIDLDGGHKRGIWALHVIDDKVYSGSYDGRISAWTTAGACSQTFKAHQSQVLCLTSNEQGQLISGSSDHEVRLWSSSGFTKLFYHPYGVYGLCSLPNQNLAFSSCQMPKDQHAWEYQIRIGSLKNQKLGLTLKGHKGAIAELKCLSPGDIISASADQTVGIWNVETGLLKKQLKGHTDYVYTCENIDENTIVAGSKDRSISLWDARSLSLIEKIPDAHVSTIYSVKNLGHHLIASGSRDMTVAIWDVRSYKSLQSFECPAFVYRVEKIGSSILVAGLAAPEEMSTDKTKAPSSAKINLKMWKFN